MPTSETAPYIVSRALYFLKHPDASPNEERSEILSYYISCAFNARFNSVKVLALIRKSYISDFLNPYIKVIESLTPGYFILYSRYSLHSAVKSMIKEKYHWYVFYDPPTDEILDCPVT